MLHIKLSNQGLKDIDATHELSRFLAHYFPKSDQCVTGIHELLINAIEHGNLGIGFETKSDLMRRGKWKDEIKRRLIAPEYACKEIEIKLTHTPEECRLTIRDQGDGFAWQDFVGRTIDARRPNGRGLLIAYNCKFDRVIYNARGNEVTCVALSRA
jgi:anti-sigma regulatory factor (Ser/Thr protein kinase)